jgi:hypothetical protein
LTCNFAPMAYVSASPYAPPPTPRPAHVSNDKTTALSLMRRGRPTKDPVKVYTCGIRRNWRGRKDISGGTLCEVPCHPTPGVSPPTRLVNASEAFATKGCLRSQRPLTCPRSPPLPAPSLRCSCSRRPKLS